MYLFIFYCTSKPDATVNYKTEYRNINFQYFDGQFCIKQICRNMKILHKLVHLFCFSCFYGNTIARASFNVYNFADVQHKADDISYRLPNNTKPEFYNISLVTFVNRNEFNFSGVVQINVLVIEDSRNITLHARQLTIEKVQLTDIGGNAIDDATFDYNISTEFLTVTTDRTLLTGEKYILKVFYYGELRDDLQGFYRSSYVDEHGIEVYVISAKQAIHTY